MLDSRTLHSREFSPVQMDNFVSALVHKTIPIREAPVAGEPI